MNEVKTVTGDLVKMAEEGLFDIVIHGCNIENTMFSGIANTIRTRWPEAEVIDRLTKQGEETKLGKITSAWIQRKKVGFYCINAYTQYLGKNSKYGIPLCYNALHSSLYQVKLLHDLKDNVPRIGIPKIGSLRGGGDWDTVLEIIKSIGFRDITVVEYDGEINR